MLSLTAGFTFHIGKTGWKRAVDAAPYIRRSERLAEYVDFLSEENRRYAGRHDCDRRTLAELKKILEIEGLVDAYGHILQEDGEVAKITCEQLQRAELAACAAEEPAVGRNVAPRYDGGSARRRVGFRACGGR